MGKESINEEESFVSSANQDSSQLTILTANPTGHRTKETSETDAESEGSTEPEFTSEKSDETLTLGRMKDVQEDPNEFIVKYKGQRYDIQDFLKRHPGGSKILNAYRDSNIDEAMVTNSHSTAAFHLFQEFLQDNKEAYQEIERLVDWNAPLLSQVGALGDRYWEWVNLPVNRPIRLFTSDVIESLTVTPWYMVPAVWLPIFCLFVYRGFSREITGDFRNSIPQIVIAFAWGFLLWTLLEYGLHRKLFHMKPPGESKRLITLHFLLHGLHHKAPFDSQRLVFPPAPGICVAVVIYLMYSLMFPFSMPNFVAAGTSMGYLFYDMTHYYLHYGSPAFQTYMYEMKRYHNYHHFSHHEEGFGISSKLWDYVFGTMITLRNLKKAIEW